MKIDGIMNNTIRLSKGIDRNGRKYIKVEDGHGNVGTGYDEDSAAKAFMMSCEMRQRLYAGEYIPFAGIDD